MSLIKTSVGGSTSTVCPVSEQWSEKFTFSGLSFFTGYRYLIWR